MFDLSNCLISLLFPCVLDTPYSQRLEDNIIGYQDHNPIIAQAYSLMRTVQEVRYYTGEDTMDRLITRLSICETVDEFSSLVEIVLSLPEVSQLRRLHIFYPIPKRSLVCFNHVLGKLQNLQFFKVFDRLNAMLPAHTTKLWLNYFRSPAPASWYKLSNLTQLTELKINGVNLDETDCDQLIQLLGNNQTLGELVISDIRIPPYKIVSLMEIIGNLSRLQRLRLDGLNWEWSWQGIYKCAFVWEPLNKLQALKELTIGQETVLFDFEVVMNIIKQFYQLNSLELIKSCLHDYHIKALMTLLRSRPIMRLRIIRSYFSLAGLYELAREAECDPKLESVFINKCLFREWLPQDADRIPSRRSQEEIEADKQIALRIEYFCPKMKFSDFKFNY